MDRDISWQIPHLVNHLNDKSGTINGNIYQDDSNLPEEDNIRKSGAMSLARRAPRLGLE